MDPLGIIQRWRRRAQPGAGPPAPAPTPVFVAPSPALPAPPAPEPPPEADRLSEASSDGSGSTGGGSGSPGSPGGAAGPGPRRGRRKDDPAEAGVRQAQLGAALERLLTPGAKDFVQYPSFVCYLAGPPAEGGACARAAAALRAAAGGPVFLADGLAFTAEALAGEFPELELFFRGRQREAFAESPAEPGVWLETRAFADLRGLSRMRRELRARGAALAPGDAPLLLRLLGAPAS